MMSQALAAACVALLIGVGGVPDPDLPEDPCLSGTSPCETTTPGPGANLVENLRPYVDRATYQQLRELASTVDAISPPDPIPARPTGAAVEATVAVHAGLKAGGSTASGSASVAAGANATRPTGAEPGQIACTPAGCPDLVVDVSSLALYRVSTEEFTPSHCAVEENATQAGHRRLLRFTFTTPNVGDGDLVVGAPRDHPELFTWGTCHGHHHFREYADYRLWEPETYAQWLALRWLRPDAAPGELLEAHPHLADGFVAGHKQGFCVMDVRPYVLTYAGNYWSCSENQGIRRGWADEYGAGLDGQWIDVTDVHAGVYVLEAEVNPERVFTELDHSNNWAAVVVAV